MTASSTIQTHVDAFLLAVASSTDNFMVGITAGLSTPSISHFYKVNLAVALCNSLGTLLATHGGVHLKRLPELALMQLAAAVSSSSSSETYQINFSIESLLAGVAFLYLAIKEYREDDILGDDGDDDDKNKKRAGLSYSIALPMTLNNLAGGVAGGVLGLSAIQATIYAFLVSFATMAIGHALASRIVLSQQTTTQNNSHSKKNPTTQWCKPVAVLIYLLLAVQSLLEV